MKLDNQRRLQIPKFIREEKNLNPGDKILIAMVEDSFKLIKQSSNENILGSAKMDSKGRIIIPVYLKEHFVDKEVLFYIKGEKKGVGLILKEMS